MVENTNGNSDAAQQDGQQPVKVEYNENSELQQQYDAQQANGGETANGSADGNNGDNENDDGGHSQSAGGDGAAKSAPTDPEPFRKLFVGGLSLTTTDEGLQAFYAQFGEILDCVVMKDSQTKKSRGFGFVSFTCREEVDRAMAARPHEIDGKTVDPKRAVPRDQSARSESNISTKRLYVSGVREVHNEEALRQHFAQFGNVEKVEIINDKVTQKPRGFAFVSFDDHDAVDKCVLLKSHMINDFRCDVKKALSREDMARAQQMDRDRMERGARSRGPQRGGPPGGNAPWAGGRGYGGGSGGGYGGAWGGQQAWGAGGGQQSWSGGQQAGGQWGPPGGAYGGGYGGGYGGSYGGGYGNGGAAAGGGWSADSAGGWGSGAGAQGAGGQQSWGGGRGY